ncbi:MAG: thioredoxin family protein [Bacillaceae bacterium]|nr:thioredoxin family protein [Bacillaceae bacterium]
MEKITAEEQFEQVINQDKCIIKFFADWCPDCRRMDMFIGDIMRDHAYMPWYEINTDEFPELREKYDVMGVPSLLVFEKGQKTAHLHSANAKTPDQVRAFLDDLK